MANYSKEPSFTETGLNSSITEFALALVGVKNDNWFGSGTAVLIAGNLALTAKHVILDYLRRYNNVNACKGNFTLSGNILARQILHKGATARIWTVKKIWISPITDVAFLYLSPFNNEVSHRKRACCINLLPPPIGARVVGFGYHSSCVSGIREKDITKVEWKDSPTTTVGEVVEIYTRQRDSHMLNFPCYRVNARFEPGMSGGPVFNNSGEVCGLICSSIQQNHKRSYISYVATLWPSLGTVLDLQIKEFTKGVTYKALELARLDYIKARNWEYIIHDVKETGDSKILFKGPDSSS